MKKAFVFLLVILAILIVLLSIFKKDKPEVSNETDNSINTDTVSQVSEEPEDKYVDTNPVKLGIYTLNDAKTKRVLVKEVNKSWVYYNDIIEYNVFYTQDDGIDTTRVRECFDKYADKYQENVVDNYKIGYHLNFKIGDKEIDKTILCPKDADEFFEYLEVYLYDGYHRAAGQWYSHTTQAEWNENTLLAGIKLTTGKKIKEITSDITLTAFSYDADDFDESGNYKGNSKYSIVIKNGNK